MKIILCLLLIISCREAPISKKPDGIDYVIPDSALNNTYKPDSSKISIKIEGDSNRVNLTNNGIDSVAEKKYGTKVKITYQNGTVETVFFKDHYYLRLSKGDLLDGSGEVLISGVRKFEIINSKINYLFFDAKHAKKLASEYDSLIKKYNIPKDENQERSGRQEYDSLVNKSYNLGDPVKKER